MRVLITQSHVFFRHDKKDICELSLTKNPPKKKKKNLSPLSRSKLISFLSLQTKIFYLGFRFLSGPRISETSQTHMELELLGGFSYLSSYSSAYRPLVSPKMAALGSLSLCPCSLLWRPKLTKRSFSCSVGSPSSVGEWLLITEVVAPKAFAFLLVFSVSVFYSFVWLLRKWKRKWRKCINFVFGACFLGFDVLFIRLVPEK